jgi:diguanylate cyclase (GGDEF)-like protein
MTSRKDSYDSALTRLRDVYAQELPKKIGTLQRMWAAFQVDGTSTELLATVRRMVHSLVGAGGTLGFPEISQRARELELFLDSILDCDAVPTQPQCTEIDRLMEALAHGCEISTDSPMARQERDRARPSAPASSGAPAERERCVLVLLDNQDEAELLRDQMVQFGYAVQICSRLDELRAQREGPPPEALIVDLELVADSSPGALAEIRGSRRAPVLVVSSDGRLEARLRAVRAGGDGFFTRPVDADSLVDTLERSAVEQVPQPYRILIVEDDIDLASYFQVTLEQAGLSARAVNRPLDVMRHLREYKPDLILMDVYMPDCNGSELAAAIRQQEAYVSTPIVFLSAETNPDKQLAAISRGGDDFLTKPILVDHLISSVMARAQRSRILQSLMARDGLTGLLNHTKTKEVLEVELSRSRRLESSVVLAMIDLDRFKGINDTFGHAAGDRVLKSLARLLQQRLRKTDLVGRYGGEEFAVILPGTSMDAAYGVMDELREAFSRIRYRCDHLEFRVTFSCGLAAYPGTHGASALLEAADAALYRAKRMGRNRVEAYEPPSSF